MLQKMMTSLERAAYGSNSFLPHKRATRALLKFCDDHQCSHHDVSHVRACLAALEAGEKSNAIAAVKRIRIGKEGFHEWWPKPIPPLETDEYAWAVFEAVFERWHRLITQLPDWR